MQAAAGIVHHSRHEKLLGRKGKRAAFSQLVLNVALQEGSAPAAARLPSGPGGATAQQAGALAAAAEAQRQQKRGHQERRAAAAAGGGGKRASAAAAAAAAGASGAPAAVLAGGITAAAETADAAAGGALGGTAASGAAACLASLAAWQRCSVQAVALRLVEMTPGRRQLFLEEYAEWRDADALQ